MFLKNKFYLIIFIILLFFNINNVFWYCFGITSNFNNSFNDVLKFEKENNFKIKLLSFIFDKFGDKELLYLKNQIKILWKNRIYHITISPMWYSAKELAEWKFNKYYIKFFNFIKKENIKVIFRTMHEMNWNWYSWSWDPKNFKKAWVNVYNLSRYVWLNKYNILFDFSVNSIDLPKNKYWRVTPCYLKNKKRLHCLTFEDYYPWNKYVDLMWMTLFNWWRAKNYDWAYWKTFKELLFNKKTQMFSRLKSYWKKIIIDELWTTAVNYYWKYNKYKVKFIYKNNNNLKNKWLKDAYNVIKNNKEIAAVIYFNRDKTNWLKKEVNWELDWSVINYKTKKIYSWILFLYLNSNINSLPFKKINWKIFNNNNKKNNILKIKKIKNKDTIKNIYFNNKNNINFIFNYYLYFNKILINKNKQFCTLNI